jgi:hypothetical protein
MSQPVLVSMRIRFGHQQFRYHSLSGFLVSGKKDSRGIQTGKLTQIFAGPFVYVYNFISLVGTANQNGKKIRSFPAPDPLAKKLDRLETGSPNYVY